MILKPWLPGEHAALTITANNKNTITLPGGDPSFLGGFLYLQESDRKILADDFFANPIRAMANKNNDDQPALGRLLRHATPVQRLDPDAIVLYKVEYVPLGMQPGNKIILFHGQPRPWDSGEPWVPPLEP